MSVVNKLKTEDKEALDRIYTSKDWEVFYRVFLDVDREVIHREMESINSLEDLAFAQGQIHQMKKIIKGMKENHKGRDDGEEGEDDAREHTTTYVG